MKFKTPCGEVESDIVLQYKGSCPFKSFNDLVISPVKDDTGTTYHFPGPAYIVMITEQQTSAGVRTFEVYLQT